MDEKTTEGELRIPTPEPLLRDEFDSMAEDCKAMIRAAMEAGPVSVSKVVIHRPYRRGSGRVGAPA